eukprot:Lankesteria_metandrocarpae@DN5358_c0_g1_i2.p1
MVCAKSILIVATSIAAALLIDATGGPSETSNSGKKRSLSPRRSERSLSPQRKESSPFPLTEAGGRDGSPSKVSEIDSSSESSPELPLSGERLALQMLWDFEMDKTRNQSIRVVTTEVVVDRLLSRGTVDSYSLAVIGYLQSWQKRNPQMPINYDHGIFFSCVNKGAVIQLFMLFNDVVTRQYHFRMGIPLRHQEHDEKEGWYLSNNEQEHVPVEYMGAFAIMKDEPDVLCSFYKTELEQKDLLPEPLEVALFVNDVGGLNRGPSKRWGTDVPTFVGRPYEMDSDLGRVRFLD